MEVVSSELIILLLQRLNGIMQALKGLVVGLGILIVFGMSVIGYGLYRKANDPGFKFFGSNDEKVTTTTASPSGVPTLPATPTVPTQAFGEAMVGLPAGCTIDGVSGDGARIYLRIGPTTAECQRVVVLNAATGAQIGVIRIAR